ncbi:MAG: DUF1080 domain-containing protein, partial [Planctomycetota bacterium]|nr:DUF1080 domain-containing protein [Planctomycetota bacterium]
RMGGWGSDAVSTLRIGYAWGMSFLAPLCIASALFAGPQEQEWGVHDMERPLPPRVEGAKALELPAPEGATVLFDGKNLDLWQHHDGSAPKWQVKDGYFEVKGGSGDLRTKKAFGDVHLHLEWRVPKSEEGKTGQAFGNSGVFLMNTYEIQVLETSTNRTYADGMAGAMYGQYPPMVNAGAGPGEWNSYDIYFQSPRFENGQVNRPAWVTVFHNGYVIHEGRRYLGATTHKRRASYSSHGNALPLRLQDHGDPVQFRNIWVRPLPWSIDNWGQPHYVDNGMPSEVLVKEQSRFNDIAGDLRKHVERITAIHPRPDGAHPSGMQMASSCIASELTSMGYEVHSQTFLAEGRPYRNLIVRIGSDKGPLTVIGAHYDVCDSSPGADDNASGVAVLLELAKHISHQRILASTEIKTPLELVFYALEEPPYFRTKDMGSAHHAKALKAAGTEVRGMISLEMLGYYDETEGSQEYPIPAMAALYPKAGNFLALVGRPEDQAWITHWNTAMGQSMSLPLETLAAPREVEGVDFSDHQNYWDAGFTAMMLTDTAHLRNPHYHKMTDTADTLNYDHMADIVSGVLAAIRALDKK